jgi:hypothetical protein
VCSRVADRARIKTSVNMCCEVYTRKGMEGLLAYTDESGSLGFQQEHQEKGTGR